VFVDNLETVMILIRERTGFVFVPDLLTTSLLNPFKDFMVVFHKISCYDKVKLPNLDAYQAKVPLLARAFELRKITDETSLDLQRSLLGLRN